MRRLMHDTNERASERLGKILDLPTPQLLAKAGLDVWQAYGLHWLLCEIVGFVVQSFKDDRTPVRNIAYSMRRWSLELRADEAAVTEGFSVLKQLGMIEVVKERGGMIRVGVLHLDAYADKVWNLDKTDQQRQRRQTKKQDDSKLTQSQPVADSTGKDVRTTRKGKDVRTTARAGRPDGTTRAAAIAGGYSSSTGGAGASDAKLNTFMEQVYKRLRAGDTPEQCVTKSGWKMLEKSRFELRQDGKGAWHFFPKQAAIDTSPPLDLDLLRKEMTATNDRQSDPPAIGPLGRIDRRPFSFFEFDRLEDARKNNRTKKKS